MKIRFLRRFFSKPKAELGVTPSEAEASETLPDPASVATHNRLLARLAEEEQLAKEKIANPSYWLNVGHIEMQAVYDIRRCLNGIPRTLPDASYVFQTTNALNNLAIEWRQNSDDTDGYGVATVHAIGRLLPDYTGGHEEVVVQVTPKKVPEYTGPRNRRAEDPR